MKTDNKRLLIRQMDEKLKQVGDLNTFQFSKEGWVRNLRKLLNISLEQLANKVGVTAPAIKGIEDRERTGAVTIKSLNQVAEAMDMKVVYIFVPKDGSLEQLIERKAREVAKKIVLRSSTTMRLEDQATSNERLKDAIEELTDELKRKIPGTLWD